MLSSLLLINFGLSVSAASDDGNLINPDLTDWSLVDSSSSDSWSDFKNDYGNTVYRLFGKGVNSLLLQTYFDVGDIVAGHSYTLSFHLPDLADIQSCYNTTMTDSTLRGYYKNSSVLVGYGFLSPDYSTIENTYPLFEITSANLDKYLGRTLTSSFIASSGSGRPIVYITIGASDNSTHYFFFQDFKLVDNDDNSKELTGIRGFLHSIRWDLVGGTCDEEDCPHSSDSNPHLSLTDRMSAGFQSFFDSLGESIFNLGEAIGEKLKFNFSESIINVSNGFDSVGEWFDSVGEWFDGLGTRISGFFDNLGDRISGFFSNLGNRISGFFSDLWKNLSEWFEKFKPRVYLNFIWQFGYLDENGYEIYDYNSGTAIVTELFSCNTPYKFDFYSHSDAGSFSSLYVFIYDPLGNFIGCNEYLAYEQDVFTEQFLVQGYSYRFMIIDDSWSMPEDIPLSDYCNSLLTVYADEGWINAVIFNIESGIKRLFIPDVNIFNTYSQKFETLFSEHLGIVYDVTVFLGDFISTIKDLLSDTEDGDLIFVFPGVSFELNGHLINLWPDKQVDMSFIHTNSTFMTIYGIYKIFLVVSLCFMLSLYAYNTFEGVLRR